MALVGTGLEDPELLTLKAVRAIEAADLVEASGRQRWEVVGAGEEKKANLEESFCIYSCHVVPRQGVWTYVAQLNKFRVPDFDFTSSWT